MSEATSPEFERSLRAAMAAPEPSSEFVNRLAAQLRIKESLPPQFAPARRPVFGFSLAVLLILLAAILAIGPQRVLAQVLDWLGYVPGVGFVNQEGGLRVLANPVSQTRDGITVTIEDGLVDAENTWLTFYFEGIRQEQKPTSEDVPGCYSNPEIVLPDGEVLLLNGGSGGGGPSWMRTRFSYPALPTGVNKVLVRIACVPEVLPGMGPEDWEFTINFLPAPEVFEVLPVSTLPFETESSQAGADSELHGVHLEVSEFVELEDGYLFRGSLSWELGRYQWIDFGGYLLQAQDAAGNKIALEEVYDDTQLNPPENSIPWSVRTNRKDIVGPVRLFAPQLAVQMPAANTQEVVFALSFNGDEQQTWQLNEIVSIQGKQITIREAFFAPRGDGFYNLRLTIEAQPDEISAIYFRDLDNESKMLGGGGGGEPGGEFFVQEMEYDYVPEGQHRFTAETFYSLLEGPWRAEVDIPPAVAATSTPPTKACLTEATWQAAVSSPQPLPSEIGGRILLDSFEAGAMLPTLVLSELGSADRVVIGQGSWATISPDGQSVAFAYQGLRIMHLASGRVRLLIAEDSSYSLAWSPNGQRIALIRGGDGVYTINADGSQLQRVPNASADMVGIAGWLPDGERVVVSRIVPEGTMLQSLDVNSGETHDLFHIDNLKGGFAELSPDGSKVAYSGSIFGEMGYGIFISNLDGTDQRLLAEPNDALTFLTGAWSPDAQWLILNPYNLAAYDPVPQHPLLVNVHSCEIFVIDTLLGKVSDWGP